MIVQDIMKQSSKSCNPDTSLAAAAKLLSSAQCAALPVVDAKGKVVGLISDRNICVALGTRNQRASELTVAQVISGEVAACRPSDEIHSALTTMRAKKLRRLSVVDDQGRLEGMLCLNDVILYARHSDGRRPELSYEDVMGTFKGICQHPKPVTLAASQGATRRPSN